jgi:hypothetical protein
MEYPGIQGATIGSSKQRSAAKTALGFKRDVTVTETDMDSSPNSYRMTHKKSYDEEKTPASVRQIGQIFPRDAQSVI